MVKRLFLTALTLGLVVAFATSASALSRPKLSFQKGGGATIGWSSDGSSPADTTGNSQSIRISVPAGGGASAYTYGASEALVGIRGESLTGIDHLGFDSRGYLGNGAPRISLGTVTVGTTDPNHAEGSQHTFFLSAYYCNDLIGGGWRTSDFVDSSQSPGTSTAGALGGCYVFDQNGVPYGPNGLDSVAVAYPNDVVQSTPNDWFLNQDESPATLNVDRLSVENWVWVRSGNNGILNCNTASCI